MNKLELIQSIVETEMGLKKGESKNPSREPIYVEARCMIYYVGFKVYGLRKIAIAHYFGKDHTTILHGIIKAQDILETEKPYRQILEKVLTELSEAENSEADVVSKEIQMLSTIASFDNAILKKSA